MIQLKNPFYDVVGRMREWGVKRLKRPHVRSLHTLLKGEVISTPKGEFVVTHEILVPEKGRAFVEATKLT